MSDDELKKNVDPTAPDIDKNQRYYFMPHKGQPGYFHVVDVMASQIVFTWPHNMTVMFAVMYRKLIDTGNMALANEFMYGVVMGCTMAAVYADELPRVEKIRDPVTGKLTGIRQIQPDGQVREDEIRASVGGVQMMEMLGRMGLTDQLEQVAESVGMNVAPAPDQVQ